jgi:hypothetical protein
MRRAYKKMVAILEDIASLPTAAEMVAALRGAPKSVRELCCASPMAGTPSIPMPTHGRTEETSGRGGGQQAGSPGGRHR